MALGEKDVGALGQILLELPDWLTPTQVRLGALVGRPASTYWLLVSVCLGRPIGTVSFDLTARTAARLQVEGAWPEIGTFDGIQATDLEPKAGRKLAAGQEERERLILVGNQPFRNANRSGFDAKFHLNCSAPVQLQN